MSKHTPGPWLINQVQNEPEKITIIDADMCFVAEVWQTYVNGESRQQENAHLIAAAPAMYEALQQSLVLVELAALEEWGRAVRGEQQPPTTEARDRLEKVKAALAQAEGSKP